MTDEVWTAFENRKDLLAYGDNALLVFALQMNFALDDIQTVALASLTDGPDDKKCDLIYVDRDARRAVIAQGYFSSDVSKSSAPANKASDLNTAASWALGMDLLLVPERIRNAVTELRDAINSNSIEKLEFWYVHNLPESVNVQIELEVVKKTAKSASDTYLSGNLEIIANEVGRESLCDWYRGLTVPILVADQLVTPVGAGYEISGKDWRAFVTAVSAEWLRDLFITHGRQLFSANIRDYLGSRRTDSNINNGIKETAYSDPGHFWTFNNGITVLTHNFSFDGKELTVSGMSIVNGAQTTGALGSLTDPPSADAQVPARFVVANSPNTVEGIIRYNNSQNRIEATDFRSNDPTQRRLVEEFDAIPDCTYRGGRRGGSEDFIKRPGDLVASSTVGQALAAFHGRPVVAYNSKSNIWREDRLYNHYFNDNTTAEHVVLVYSLLKGVESRKQELLQAEKNEDKISETGQELLNFYKKRGATMLMVAAVGACMEIFTRNPIPSRFDLSFGKISPSDGIKKWTPILDVAEAFAGTLEKGVAEGFNTDAANEAIAEFRQLLNATKSVNESVYRNFASELA